MRILSRSPAARGMRARRRLRKASFALEHLESRAMLAVGAVESLTAAVRFGEVGLSWRAPATSAGALITDYVIQYRNGNSEPWGTFPDGISTATTAVVAGLTVSDSYDFRVAAVATTGTGPWSESCTFAYGFSNELLLTADWIPAGSWRLESDGVRLQHWNSSLTSKQSFGSDTQTIELAYEITDRTQLWVSLWGETFVFEPPLGGGAVTAQITRDGEAVTFTNGITSPTTVILKQANKDVATPLLIRMDQLNLWRPEMELRLARVAVSRDLRTTPKLPSTPAALVAFPSTLNAMQLAWAAPSDGGSTITDYLVQYSIAGSGTWMDFADGIAGRTFAFVNFLDRQMEHVFRVAAVNAIGVGPWSAASLPAKPGGFSMPTDTRHHVFSHEGWFDAEWAVDGEWRLESTGTRLMNHQAKLMSKQSLVTRHTRRIEIAYEITPTTQLWVSLWGETFSFEPPAGGGAAVAEIIRNGESVTFSNGFTQPTTVVLKRQNKDVATPLVIQMDQRNLYRPTMELLVKRIARGQEMRLSAVRPDAPSTVAAAPGNRSRDVQLSWTAPGVWDIPDVGKPITDYLIQSSADAGATWTDLATDSSSSTHTTVTNLDPGREYVFRVAAVNAVGIGPWSTASVPVRPAMDVVTAETRHFGFSHEAWLDASWTTGGVWRLESDGIRLQHWTSSLTSKQPFGSDTQSIEFSYEITDRTQLWVSLWGETFVFEAPAGGGAATARITRNGEAVTFTNGIGSPTTVILKQANKDVATPLLIQMDQRNLYRPEMELLLKSVDLTTARATPCIVNPASGETLTDETPYVGSCQLVKQGLGTLVLNQTNTHSGGTVVENGELVARNPAAFGIGSLKVNAGAKVTLDVGRLQVSVSGLELSPFGVLDLATGSLRIAPGGYDLTEIRGLLASARGNGSWSGPGITSSSIQSGTSRAVGYRVLQDGSLLLGYAAVGDANMDGQVDLIDMLGVLAANTYNAEVTAGWSEGDFNYDGVTNLLDLLAVLGSGEYGQGMYFDRDSGVTSAQESDLPDIEAAAKFIPASAGIFVVGAPGSINQTAQQDAATQTTTASSTSLKASPLDHVDQLAGRYRKRGRDHAVERPKTVSAATGVAIAEGAGFSPPATHQVDPVRAAVDGGDKASARRRRGMVLTASANAGPEPRRPTS